MYFFRCGNFLGCKAGLSLLLVFSCLGRFFSFLGRVFSRLGRFFPAASKMHFFCCKGAFVLLQGVFSAALNFSRCEAAFFAGVFSRCGNSFFLLPNAFFFRSDVFFLLRTCVFRALREDKELENVESYTGRSPLVSWIAHGQIGDKGDQTLKQPSATEKLKRAAVDAATCFNGSGYKRRTAKRRRKSRRTTTTTRTPTTTTRTTTTAATSTTTTSTITTITTTTRSSMGSMDNMCSMRSMGSARAMERIQ